MLKTATIRLIAVGLALAPPLVGHAAYGQGVPTAPGAAPGTPGMTMEAAVDQRIQTLKAQLAITPQQEPLWDAFAQKMRNNAMATDHLAQQRAAALPSMSAVDNLRSYARITHAYAADADRLTAAFEGLYANLSPAQRQAADTLFRQQPAAPQ